MGLLTDAFTFRKALTLPSYGGGGFSAAATPRGGAAYESYVREGYQNNEIVYSAIELLATSAAEPHIVGRRYPSASARDQAKAYYRYADATGLPRWVAAEVLSKKQLEEELSERDHPLIRLLNHPSPFVSGPQFWSTIVMDRYLAGNSFVLKARGAGGRGRPEELWRLRPDRVKVVPNNPRDPTAGIAGYVYQEGNESAQIEARDIIHYKTRHPLDYWYGMPPLMALTGRIDLDNYMREFVRTFFRRGGQPGAVLSIKQKLSQEAKDDIRDRFRRQFGGSAGWFDLLVLDAAESTFTPVTMQLGQRGLVMPELNNITEARIAMGFGIPPGILGLLVGLETSSYANQRQARETFWKITMMPLLREIDAVTDMALVPEYGDVDEAAFDVTEIEALQEETDKLHERARRNVAGGLWTQEEGRILTGVEAMAGEGYFLLPAGVLPVAAGDLGSVGMTETPEQRALSALRAWLSPPVPEVVASLPAPELLAEVRCPTCNKLCARDVSRGENSYCRRCRKAFPAGAERDVRTATRRQIVRDEQGFISEIVEDVIDAV